MNADPSSISLTFKIGDESFPIVLSEKEVLKTPFAETVEQAKECIIDVDERLRYVRNNKNENIWLTETPSNILTLLGDRGSGKTSCMRTLIKILKDEQENKDGLHKAKWLFTDEIDPSFFDEKHNILELFIGSLFGIYNNVIKNIHEKKRADQEIIRRIHEGFRKVKSALTYLDDHKLYNEEDEYEIDALKHLDEGGRIRLLLKNLIDDILKYEESDCIIMSIDDLDLNINQSFTMLEHINKFLRLPNLIILIAAKYEQLFNSICLDLSESYKAIEYRVSHKDIAEMAERYLNKLLPLPQRFIMPMPESYMNVPLIILNQDGSPVYDKTESVLNKVPSLIFEKTRFLFYNSTGMPSRVIPRNLRDLRMLVTLLVNMKPIGKDDIQHKENKQQFKDYFFKEWLGLIDPDYRTFASSLLAEENIAKINKFVIMNLYDFFISKTEKIEDLKSETDEIIRTAQSDSYSLERILLYDILNPANSFWNVSIGDVVFIINYIKKKNDSNKTLDLLFFIESFYSIKLYETYDKLTVSTNDYGFIPDVEKGSDAPELKNDVKADLPDFYKLVGGSFFALTGDYFTPLPSHRSLLESREISLVNAKFLMDEIKRIEADYKKFKDSNSDPNTLPKGFLGRLRLCEFFMLCISHRQDLKQSDRNPRLVNEPIYFKHFGNTSKNLVFNIGSPFVNAICPQFAYDRFSDKIYRIAKGFSKSLLNMMIDHNRRKWENWTWDLMSKAAIRNMEVLEDLTSWLHARREDNKPGGKELVGVLHNFYDHLAVKNTGAIDYATKYCVKTYDKTGNTVGDDYFQIDYSVISILNRVLISCNPGKKITQDMTDAEKEKLEEKNRLAKERLNLFNAIFSSNDIFQRKDSYSYVEIVDVLNSYCNPIIVSKVMKGKINSNISMKDLAEILAELHILYKYDFSDRLPIELNLYYENCLRIKLDNIVNPLKENKLMMETELKNLEAEKILILEEITALRNERSQLEKEKRQYPKKLVNLEKQLAAAEYQLHLIQDRINIGVTNKTEYNRLSKDEDAAKMKIFDLNANINEIEKLGERYPSMVENIKNQLDSAIDRQKEIDKAIRQINLDIERQSRSIQNREDSLKRAFPVEAFEA